MCSNVHTTPARLTSPHERTGLTSSPLHTADCDSTDTDGGIRSFDVPFSVPMVHRLRFTDDVAGEDFSALLDVLHAGEAGPPKVMIVADRDVLAGSDVIDRIAKRLADSDSVRLMTADDAIEAGAATDRDSHGSTDVACVLGGGESIKNTSDGVDRVLDLINRLDLDRRSYIVVVGGGAILDAVGYAAAIAHRGVRLVRLPSTTLAQDDSGVGVKNAINAFGKKNWVGTFASPWAVINDRTILETLPDRDFRNGFSEAVKVSLLKSVEDFEFLCENATAIRDRDMDVAFDAIMRSCLWHLKHITAGGDPFEALEARPLDFGHWSAHKMEPMSDCTLRHGEAVGIGVALDCIYSSMVHGLTEESALAVCRCMHDLGMSLWHETLDDPEVVLEGLEEFRQHLGGRLTVTMLDGVGKPIDVHHIDRDSMRAAIGRLREIAAQWD